MAVQTIDAGTPKVIRTTEGNYFIWKGDASLEDPDDTILVVGPSVACTLTHLALEASTEPFLPEVGYTEDFDALLIDGRDVAAAALGPFRTQTALVLDAYDGGNIFIRPKPQVTTPSGGSPLLVHYVIVVREGHHA